ncbi:hypothetical protein BKA60DRAFT_584934 [Fusarium oxysporum]|nr:hypothetical protein BKA60DRAFT_584934 [Fusarium oxysporum]
MQCSSLFVCPQYLRSFNNFARLFCFLHHHTLVAIALPNMHPTQKIFTDTNKSPLIQVSGLIFLVIFLLSCSVEPRSV